MIMRGTKRLTFAVLLSKALKSIRIPSMSRSAQGGAEGKLWIDWATARATACSNQGGGRAKSFRTSANMFVAHGGGAWRSVIACVIVSLIHTGGAGRLLIAPATALSTHGGDSSRPLTTLDTASPNHGGICCHGAWGSWKASRCENTVHG